MPVGGRLSFCQDGVAMAEAAWPPPGPGCPLHLADISVPEKVYRRLGLTVSPIFAESDIVSIDLP
jgi:hypothetical protein